MEGNELIALPFGFLKLRRIKLLLVRNNYMHPLLWKENTRDQPQVKTSARAQLFAAFHLTSGRCLCAIAFFLVAVSTSVHERTFIKCVNDWYHCLSFQRLSDLSALFCCRAGLDYKQAPNMSEKVSNMLQRWVLEGSQLSTLDISFAGMLTCYF